MLRELAPLLAEEGIDVNDIDVPDMDTLQNALNRAIERRNMALFTPVGQARELALAALRLAVEAITDGDTTLAGAVLEQVEPESPDNWAPTVYERGIKIPNKDMKTLEDTGILTRHEFHGDWNYSVNPRDTPKQPT